MLPDPVDFIVVASSDVGIFHVTDDNNNDVSALLLKVINQIKIRWDFMEDQRRNNRSVFILTRMKLKMKWWSSVN